MGLNWTVISAVNNEEVLNSSLLKSPALSSASNVILERGHSSAASAYNAGLVKAETDLVVFTHQDVYLPHGWWTAVEHALELLTQTDPNWGVLGAYGPRFSGRGVGYIYDTSWQTIVGAPFAGGIEVETLDEVLLIIRKSSGLRFDPAVGGFHMYGTDLCLESRARGMKCYAIAAFCIHNTNGYGLLPLEFWKSYLHMRKKWRTQLPIMTPCIEITHNCWPMVQWNCIRALNLVTRRRKRPPQRLKNPGHVYEELVAAQRIPAPQAV